MLNNITTEAANEPLLSLSNTRLSYQGVAVLQDITLTIAAGERVALVGRSGSGKSTLLKHLRSLLAQQVAWCPQQPGLVPMLSGYHNIYMGGLARRSAFYNVCNLIKPLATPRAEIIKLANQLDIHDQLLKRVDNLSGGQQQRIAIGRALYQQQKIFLGDEPVSALDSFHAYSVLSLLIHYHDTVILALHDTEQARKVCNRIIGLKGGRIAFDLPSELVSCEQLNTLYCSE